MNQALLSIKIPRIDLQEYADSLRRMETMEKEAGNRSRTARKARHTAIQSEEIKSHEDLRRQVQSIYEKSAAQIKQVEDRLNEGRKSGLNSIRQHIFDLEKTKREEALKSAFEIEGTDTKAHALRVKQINAELQLWRSLEKEKIGRTFSEQLHKGLNGSGFNTAAAIFGVDITIAGLIKLGQEASKVDNQLLGAYKTAGATQREALLFANQTTAAYQKQGQAIGITEVKYKELSREAAFAGHFLGEANQQLVIAAAAIEKQTSGGEGQVTADRFIRAVSQGMNSEEGKESFGRLRMAMPAFVHDLEQATDREDLFKRAIAGANESVKAQIAWLASEDGAVERNTVKFQNNIEHLGKLVNRWSGAILNVAHETDVALDVMFNTLDARDAEERILLDKKIKDLEKARDLTSKSDTAAIGEYDRIITKLKAQTAAADKSTEAIEAHKQELEKEKQAASEAAAKIGILADEYNRVKAALDKLDTGRTRVEFLKDQAAIEEQKIANGQGSVWSKYFIKQIDEDIGTEGKVLAQFNKFRAKHSAKDPSEDHGGTKPKTQDQIDREAFDKAKKIEDNKAADEELKLLQRLAEDKTYTEKEFERDEFQLKINHNAAVLLLAKNFRQDYHGEMEAVLRDEIDIHKRQQEELKEHLKLIAAVNKAYKDIADEQKKDESELTRKIREYQKEEHRKAAKDALDEAKKNAKELQSIVDQAGQGALDKIFKPLEDSLSRSNNLLNNMLSGLLKAGEKKLIDAIGKALFPDPKEESKPAALANRAALMKHQDSTINTASIAINTASLTINGISNSNGGGIPPGFDMSMDALKRGDSTGAHFTRPDTEGSIISKRSVDKITKGATKIDEDSNAWQQSNEVIHSLHGIKEILHAISHGAGLPGGPGLGAIDLENKRVSSGFGEGSLPNITAKDVANVPSIETILNKANDKVAGLFKDFKPANALKSGLLSLIPGAGFLSLLGFADGGDVPRNEPYVVGERGPELRYRNKIIPLRRSNSEIRASDMPYSNHGGGSASSSEIAALHATMRSIDKKMDSRIVGVHINPYEVSEWQNQSLNQSGYPVL